MYVYYSYPYPYIVHINYVHIEFLIVLKQDNFHIARYLEMKFLEVLQERTDEIRQIWFKFATLNCVHEDFCGNGAIC